MSRLAPLDSIVGIAVVDSRAGAQDSPVRRWGALAPTSARLGCRDPPAEDFAGRLIGRGISPFILVCASAIIQCGRMARAGLPLLFVSFVLAGCAGTVNPPTLTSGSITQFDPGNAAVGQVSAVAAPGVTMQPEDLSRISRQVRTELASRYPNRLMAEDRSRRSGEVSVKLVFTQYDKGDAFARAMLAGLGQIHISAGVLLIDDIPGKTVATFAVSKTFAWGGLYGGTTRIEDVESGFARSVAEIFKKA